MLSALALALGIPLARSAWTRWRARCFPSRMGRLATTPQHVDCAVTESHHIIGLSSRLCWPGEVVGVLFVGCIRTNQPVMAAFYALASGYVGHAARGFCHWYCVADCTQWLAGTCGVTGFNRLAVATRLAVGQ